MIIMIRQFVYYWNIVFFYQKYLINIIFCTSRNKISDILNRIDLIEVQYIIWIQYILGMKICIASNSIDSIQIWYNVLIFWKCYSLYTESDSDIESNWINSNSIQFENVWHNLLIQYYYFSNIIIYYFQKQFC